MTTRFSARPLVLLAAVLPALSCCGGCEAPQWFMGILGFRGEYILVSPDVLARPGEEVRIEVRLREGEASWRPKPAEVRILREGSPYASGRTDGNGEFFAPFRPTAAGDYRFRVECYAPQKQKDGNWPLRVDVLVACREANGPLLVVDIDHTLTESHETREVLFGDPNAAGGSAAAMGRLARRHTVLYLTRRWDYLAKKTRGWLDRHGYPAGPILAARGGKALEDNEKYKSNALAAVRSRFSGPGWGIGDKASDARAYASAGLRPILFLPVNEMSRAEDVRKALVELRAAPPGTQVVAGWDEVERAVADGASFPAEAAEARLRQRLQELEPHK